MVEVTIASAAGIAAWVGLYIRRRRTWATSIPTIVVIRSILSDAPVLYARPTPRHTSRLEALDRMQREDDALEAIGFEQLGDLVFANPVVGSALRVLVASDRTVAALVALSGTAVEVTFVSATAAADQVWTTRRLAGFDLAYGPHVDVVSGPFRDLPKVFELHRARIARLPDRVAFRDLDDVLNHHAACQARTLAWRTSQEPDALLEADARAILGPRFDQLGGKLMAGLRGPVPRAVVVTKR